MSFRQDKLILLLDTGTSSQVRRTAAKQLAELVLKTFRASVTPPASATATDVKPDNDVDVKPDVDSKVTLSATFGEDDAWNDVLETISKLLPLLRSKQSETRHAVSLALGLLAASLPPYTIPTTDPSSSTSRPIDLAQMLREGDPLLASAGREYIAKPTGGDKAKRRKAMMGSLGLGDAVGWGDDVDKVIGDEDDDVDMGVNPKKENGAGGSTPPVAAEPPKDIFEGLSARQVTMLKRKKGNIAEEANKLRKLNQQAAGSTPASNSAPSTAAPTPASSPPRDGAERVTIDPGAKARAAAAAGGSGGGGAIEPVLDADGNPVTGPVQQVLKVVPGYSPWYTILEEIQPDLTDPNWQARHGSALSIMEITRSIGGSLPIVYLVELSRALLELLVLDRFGDFVGDTVIAPVRETAAQALGVLLKYLDAETIPEVHQTLVGMVRQNWAKRGQDSSTLSKGEKFAWEVRHAGLLGLKYEVAVRKDLLIGVKQDGENEGVKLEVKTEGSLRILEDVVEAAVLALRDVDDDVRTVAASALLPITETLVTALQKDELAQLLDTLWDCLADNGDDLGSSTGAVMDLLGALVTHREVIHIMSDDSRESGSRSRLSLISRIYTFIRHPIGTVRLAVAKVLHTFATVPNLPRSDWMHNDFFCLLFQNLVLEERADIRNLSFSALAAAIKEVESKAGALDITVECSLEEWYEIVMTPIGLPLDGNLFTKAGKKGVFAHNIDKHMMAGDMSLISTETVLETRIAAAKALALLRRYDLEEADDVGMLMRYLQSDSAHQIFLASVIVQEWAKDVDITQKSTESLGTTSEDGKAVAQVLISYMESPPPSTYREMKVILTRIQGECQALLNAFNVEGKVPKDKIPTLPKKVDTVKHSSDVFTLDLAQIVVGKQYDGLAQALSKNAVKTTLPSLNQRRMKVMASIGYFSVMKERYDVQVAAAVAGALIALRVMPAKFGPVVKSVMDGLKREENEILQIRSAASVASFVDFCNSPLFTGKANPSDKIIKNLFVFLCSDTAVTPIFAVGPGTTEGILSLKEDKPAGPGLKKTAAGMKEVPEESEQQLAMRLTRRGALEGFRALAGKFGSELFEKVPKFWEGISLAPITTFLEGISIDEVDGKLENDVPAGQELVDSLTSLRFVAPELDPSLYSQLGTLFPPIIASLQSSYSVIRSAAAKCLAALCDVMTDEGMRRIVDSVVPLVGDAKRVSSRRGAVEAVHHIIKLLDIKALPYVLFLIVPVLGRMSDPDEATRLLSTSTFASLVKMVPLEAGIPDPPGFSPELLAKRDEERKFLLQLLDGSKAEQYQIPIEIKADLRQYQKDGVSWLAFLAKYQLHGILCDDMGLGKSLQTICIVGSKHHERAAKHTQTASVDSAHLPTLIVCPPTLTGHWYYEIQKFTDYLRPVQYTGSAAERAALRPTLTSSNIDVVITSYETVRSDIAELSKINWLYCVLDEGHIIKNAKTKLSAAVKQLKAQHRLLLSGTPIQNNVLELWSLFDFLMPGFLGNERVFNDRFSKPILADRDGKATPKERETAASALEALHKQVLPFLLRRLKEDVLHDLPPKIIQDYYCDLSAVQRALYDEFSKSSAAEEAGEAVTTEATPGQGHVFQSLQYLRKLCNHPALVLDGPEGKERWGQVVKKVGGQMPPLTDIGHSPKLEALRQLLVDCGIGLAPAEKAGMADEMPQHRVLIFCQLRPMLDLIERDLFAALMPALRYMRMDGSTDPRKRHAIVQTFNADARIDVLLLTTSVGGLGLNLTGADTVIFVDHDWNPMKDLQAMDRAHRLGQKKVVNVYRLITRGTLEEKIMGLQRFKLNIASSVVTQQNAGLGSMNTGEVLDLFKVSADPEPGKQAKPSAGPVSASKVLEGLEDLPPEDEYAELSLSNFMSKV